MARVIVCDDDQATATRLVAALRAAGHEAEMCRHTMDVLRGAADGQFDLIVIGLDMAGFGRTGAIEALKELAPRVSLIALHTKPSEIIHAAALTGGIAAVLPRPVSVSAFMYSVERALEQKQMCEPLSPHGDERTKPFISSL
jgi:DNA-binding NtrC family response regulator